MNPPDFHGLSLIVSLVSCSFQQHLSLSESARLWADCSNNNLSCLFHLHFEWVDLINNGLQWLISSIFWRQTVVSNKASSLLIFDYILG